jgi:hypothetical protein
MKTWIKIDELRPIVESLNAKKITYGKAIELITEHCRNRVELSKLSQHDVIKNEVSVCLITDEQQKCSYRSHSKCLYKHACAHKQTVL